MQRFDVDAIRKDFPILSKEVDGNRLIFFDNAATSQKPRQVIDGIKYFYENLNANPMRSIHHLAEKASEAYNGAREKVARFINASPEEIVFVRNTTEAINLVSYAYPFKSGDRVATTYLEHHSNILPWLRLKDNGVKVDFVDVDGDFNLDMEYYKELPEDIKLITVSHESNVTGTINDVKSICRLAHSFDTPCFVDAAQSVPHQKVDVKEIGADFLAFSGHKMLGPLGIGVLYINKDIAPRLNNFLSGGEMIKNVKIDRVEYADMPTRFEAGTQNIEGAHGLGLAIDYLSKVGMDRIENYEKELMAHLYSSARGVKGIDIYSGRSGTSGPIFSFNLKSLHSHDVAYLLNKKGIAIRSGFHCAQPFVEDKLGLEGTGRASLYLYNTKEEIDTFLRELNGISARYG
jgi:cysteine desulfurase/selenocysteine lyase